MKNEKPIGDKWKNVNDRLPKYDQDVDFCTTTGKIIENGTYYKFETCENEHFYDEGEDRIYYLTDVTYWMPAPQR